jgi:hypothetical protein
MASEAREALREKVARAMLAKPLNENCEPVPWDDATDEARDAYLIEADAAIAVCMEEAARTRPKPVDEEAHHLKATDYTAGWNAAVRAYAAAIRGLKGKD